MATASKWLIAPANLLAGITVISDSFVAFSSSIEVEGCSPVCWLRYWRLMVYGAHPDCMGLEVCLPLMIYSIAYTQSSTRVV
jgi:hypothetical protein